MHFSKKKIVSFILIVIVYNRDRTYESKTKCLLHKTLLKLERFFIPSVYQNPNLLGEILQIKGL